jgi:hypothetical protein
MKGRIIFSLLGTFAGSVFAVPAGSTAYGDVDAVFYDDNNCDSAYTAWCYGLQSGVCCDASAGNTQAFGATLFLWGEPGSGKHVNGAMYSSQNNNACGAIVSGNILEGVCIYANNPLVFSGMNYQWKYDSEPPRAREPCTKTVAPDAYAFRDGAILHFLNATSVDRVHTYHSLRDAGKEVEAANYIKINADYTEGASKLKFKASSIASKTETS